MNGFLGELGRNEMRSSYLYSCCKGLARIVDDSVKLLHNYLDIIEHFHLALNNSCFFRITVEYAKTQLPLTVKCYFFNRLTQNLQLIQELAHRAL